MTWHNKSLTWSQQEYDNNVVQGIVIVFIRILLIVPSVRYIHSPEDLILYELIHFGLSRQSKHSRDIAAILKSKKSELDLDYIEGWVTRLGSTSLWKEMLDNDS